jgi:hypothetical protein
VSDSMRAPRRRQPAAQDEQAALDAQDLVIRAERLAQLVSERDELFRQVEELQGKLRAAKRRLRENGWSVQTAAASLTRSAGRQSGNGAAGPREVGQ